MSSQDFLTLEEAAKGLKKSVQTVRRMIKRGEIPAKRVKTPQGFNYVVNREDVYVNLFEQNEQDEQEKREESAPEVPVEPVAVEEAKPVGPSPEHTPEPIPFTFVFPPLPTTPVPTPQVEEASLETLTENDYFRVEPLSAEPFMKIIDMQHKEKMMLIHILEKLQEELNKPTSPAPTFWEQVKRWFSF